MSLKPSLIVPNPSESTRRRAAWHGYVAILNSLCTIGFVESESRGGCPKTHQGLAAWSGMFVGSTLTV